MMTTDHPPHPPPPPTPTPRCSPARPPIARPSAAPRPPRFYYQNYDSVAMISAVLAGFSFDALKQMSEEDKKWQMTQEENPLLWSCFAGSSVLSLSFMLMTVLSATLVQIWGPGHALRGENKNSFTAAVSMMRSERWFTIKCFTLGIMFFVATVVFYAFLGNARQEAIVIGACIGSGFALGGVSSVRIYRRFKIPEEKKIVSDFNVRESLYGAGVEDEVALLRQRHASLQAEG